ncbi:MAG: histidine phosphatase family protein [Alphaproteobacteria bacterium]
MEPVGLKELKVRRRPLRPEDNPIRIVLIRHGKPDIGRTAWLSHRKFQEFIDHYERAGLDPENRPPRWLMELVGDARRVFASDRPRARESARAVAPHADVQQSPLFMEAQLKSPRLPLVRLRPAAWAILARVAWHAGHHGGIEDFGDAKDRAEKSVEMLSRVAHEDGIAVLVAHGYFNAIVGRVLRKQGWRRYGGRHRAKYWNAVVYERSGG